MNKLFNLGAMLTIAAGAAFVNSSCSSNDMPEYNPAEIAQANYEKAFVTRFGQPAANQTWGFGEATKSGMTRTAEPSANNWGDNWKVPAPLTEAQKDIARQYFQQNQNPTGISINYTNFFVQDVYKGGTKPGDKSPETYMAADGNEKHMLGSNKMDQLFAGSDFDHISNYNNAECSENKNVWDGTGDKNDVSNQHADKIMLMVNSKTDCFGYKNSAQSANAYADQFVIISGNTIMEWANANGIDLKGADVTGMYFVGFDYEADLKHGLTDKYHSSNYLATEATENTPGAFQIPNKNDGKWYIDGGADGYYSDWIVRVIPGVRKGDIRVIAEDLTVSDKSDFDFNDVVFDVKYGNPTTIILQAAGGTLPLRVGGVEVHEAFGVSTSTMVNTGKGEEKDPVVFTVNYNTWDEASANTIPVEVQKEGEWIEIKAERAHAAAKVAVPTTFVWCDEKVDILSAYPKFDDYVEDPSIKWWVK